MDKNQTLKIQMEFGPDRIGECTVVWDKKARRFHLLEYLPVSKIYLVDNELIQESYEYEYILENWQIVCKANRDGRVA